MKNPSLLATVAAFSPATLLLSLTLGFISIQTVHAQCSPPVITFQPSDKEQFEGQPVTFTVGVSSAPECGPLTIAWYELVGVDGNLDFLPGETNTSLTVIAHTVPNDPNRNRFGCRIENAAGVVWIQEVTLTVLDADCTSPPVITKQPKSQTANGGSPVTFTVAASSPPGCQLRYQWYEIVGVDGDFNPIPGATSPSVTIIATQQPNDPDRNTFGCDVRNDAGVTFTMNAVLTVIGGTYETENIPVENSSGDTVRGVAETAASNGITTMVDSNAVGDYVTFRIPNIPAGTYDVRVRYKKHPSRGKVQALIGKINGTLGNIGPVIDAYSSSPSYQEYNLGNWTASSTSDKQIRFKVTGKNSSSSGFTMNIDYVKLIKQ